MALVVSMLLAPGAPGPVERMQRSGEASDADSRAIGFCEDPAMREFLARQAPVPDSSSTTPPRFDSSADPVLESAGWRATCRLTARPFCGITMFDIHS